LPAAVCGGGALHSQRLAGEREAEAVGEVAALSPKVMAILFSACMAVGLGTGVMVAYSIA
jgi:hypothetical protein